MTPGARNYAIVTAAYWGFTLTDGALRMLVLLHFHTLGFSAVQLAYLFLLYEVMGVLTLVGTIFLPLSFLVGLYGMNFEWIPTSQEPWGFPAALLLMVASAALPYWLFKRRGWL